MSKRFTVGRRAGHALGSSHALQAPAALGAATGVRRVKKKAKKAMA